MAQAPASADRLTPVLVGLTGYYAVAGFASLTNLAVAVWVMALVYCLPLAGSAAALVWVGARWALARRSGAARLLPV